MTIKRAEELLTAVASMMDNYLDSPMADDIMTMTVFYDDAECDGFCLLDDIKSWLEENQDNEG